MSLYWWQNLRLNRTYSQFGIVILSRPLYSRVICPLKASLITYILILIMHCKPSRRAKEIVYYSKQTQGRRISEHSNIQGPLLMLQINLLRFQIQKINSSTQVTSSFVPLCYPKTTCSDIGFYRWNNFLMHGAWNPWHHGGDRCFKCLFWQLQGLFIWEMDDYSWVTSVVPENSVSSKKWVECCQHWHLWHYCSFLRWVLPWNTGLPCFW